MKVTKFNRTVCTELRKGFEAELADLAAKYGMKASLGNMRFTDTTCTAKLELVVEGADDPKEADFRRYAALEGLEPTDLGRKFRSRTKIFTVTGYLAGRRKNNIEVTDQNGKVFITTAAELKRSLATDAVS